MLKRTRMKKSRKNPLYGKRLFTDFGGIGFYKVIAIYEWNEYCENAELPDGSHWFKFSLAKIKSEYEIVYKIPFVELGLKSVYADTGKMVLK